MRTLKQNEHPTVRQFYAINRSGPAERNGRLKSENIREIALRFGADDVGFVRIDDDGIADQAAGILAEFPYAKTLISFVRRMNREPIKNPNRSVANLEFHYITDDVNEIAHNIAAELETRGVRAANPAAGFPMDMSGFPGKVWTVSHKPVAVAAGLGKMGIHRNVIHPKFGNFIILGTVVTDLDLETYSRPIDYNPCLECKLCVSACPVGAIGADGDFNFAVCATHNYREFMGGFTTWAETIAESGSVKDYREKFDDGESASMWQSLSFGANYKAAYCMAVCPAGDDVIGPFLTDKPKFLKETVKPLQEKAETIYVVRGTDADGHVSKRFPNKKTKYVSSGLRPTSARGFLTALPIIFQRGRAKGLDAVYQFTFTGAESIEATVAISGQKIEVRDGGDDKADLKIIADSETWVGFLRKERGLVWALLTRKIKIKGPIRLLRRFAECFPSS